MERDANGMPGDLDNYITRGPEERWGVWCSKCEALIKRADKLFRADGHNFCEACAEQWGVTHEVKEGT